MSSGLFCKYDVWHNRLGYIPHPAIQHMARRGTAIGLELKPQVMDLSAQQECHACGLENAIHRPLNQMRKSHATQVGERIHTDIAGPFPESGDGKRYFISFIDEKSRYAWIDFLINRSQALMMFKKFKKECMMMTKRRIQAIRCDNDGEYSSEQFITFLIEPEIHRETTVPHNLIKTVLRNALTERLVI